MIKYNQYTATILKFVSADPLAMQIHVQGSASLVPIAVPEICCFIFMFNNCF